MNKLNKKWLLAILIVAVCASASALVDISLDAPATFPTDI